MSTHVAKDYVPSIINSRPLLPRLASELSALEHECKRAWPDFKQHPMQATAQIGRAAINMSRQVLLAPNVLDAVFTVMAVVVTVLLFERKLPPTVSAPDQSDMDLASEVSIVKLNEL